MQNFTCPHAQFNASLFTSTMTKSTYAHFMQLLYCFTFHNRTLTAVVYFLKIYCLTKFEYHLSCEKVMHLAHKPAHCNIGTTNGNKNKLPQLMQWKHKGRAEVQHHSLLTSALRERERFMIKFTFWPLYSPGKSSSTHCWEGWSGWAWRTENPFPPPAFEPWAALPLASHYINSRFLQSIKVGCF